MPLQTFRYAACGGANMVLGLTIYYVLINYVFDGETVNFYDIILKSHNAALFVAFCFNFVFGFILNKYVVFTTSLLRGRIQLFRYFLSFFSNLIINYYLLMLFIEVWHIHKFGSQLMATTIIVAISFVTQKYFTFKH